MKKSILFIIIALVIILIIGVGGTIMFYNSSLKPVLEGDSNEVIVEIKNGATATDIGEILEENNLIKNSFAFKVYTRLNNVSGMKAGTYKLNQNMSVSEIIDTLQKGTDYFPDEFNITFVEGKNMRWIASTIAQNTNNTESAAFNKLSDKDYIQTLIDKYWFLTDAVLDENIYYPLEGYLFPDTYTFANKNVTLEDIFTAMLDQMEEKLEPYKEEIQSQGFSVHKVLTVASIVELEAARVEDRSGVASVLYNRLKNNMALGSDVTTYYAVRTDMSDRDLYQSELDKYNPYNTRGPQMEGKLPIGPICSVGIKSIEAALRPDDTDYLYFVADKNGEIYFAETLEDHNKNIEELQGSGLWYEYNKINNEIDNGINNEMNNEINNEINSEINNKMNNEISN